MSTPGTLAPFDQALIAALHAWAGAEALPLLRRFGVQKARELAPALNAPASGDPLEALRDARSAQVGPDPARVHPSWFVRALVEESPAVRRVVAAGTPEPIRSALVEGLGLRPADLAPDGPGDPEVRRFVLGIWTERLVGDEPRRPDDPATVVALTALGPVGLYRVARSCALAKLSELPEASRGSERALGPGRLSAFSRLMPDPVDSRLVQLASNDWEAARPLERHRLAGLGIVTLGRLLATVDPYRVRWALQHIPYPIAKRLRVAMSQPQAAVRAVLAWEARILDAALARLVEEGRRAIESTPEGSRTP